MGLVRNLMAFGLLIAPMMAGSAQADTYYVNRSLQGVTLTGTVDVPVGNYIIQNAGAHPFADVDLTLTFNATSYNIVNALTGLIFGTGQFIIIATPTSLTFDTANARVSDPADLVFSETDLSGIRYIIGSDATPGFEIAYTGVDTYLGGALVSFPTVFGTAIPEPSSALLVAGFGAVVSMLRRRRSYETE